MVDHEWNLATGLSHWVKRRNPDGSIPEDLDDPRMLHWIENQRRQYWRWKRGLEPKKRKEDFDKLERSGFVWGEESNYVTVDAKGMEGGLECELEADDSSLPHNVNQAASTENQGNQESEKKSESEPMIVDNVGSLDGQREDSLAVETPRKVDCAGSDSTKSVASVDGNQAGDMDESTKNCSPEAIMKTSLPDSNSTKNEAHSEEKCPDDSDREQTPKGQLPKSEQEEASSHEGEESASESEPEPPKKAARTTTSTRRSSRTSVRGKDLIGTPKNAEDGSSTRRITRLMKSASSSTKDSTRTGRKASSKATREEPELRMMQRIVPIEKQEELINQVKEEFKDLLVCSEPLVEDKENGILGIDVRLNRLFEQRFLDFLVFKKAYGHGFVPKIFPENAPLGRWCCKLRSWRNTKNTHLTKSRRRRLDAAGFVWNPKADKEFWRLQAGCVQAIDLWEENFQELLKFKAEKGHVLVPKEYKENRRLARWVLKQRRNYKAKQNGDHHALDDEREQRLIEIGFVFNSRTPELMRQNVLDRFKDRWAENIEKLRQFKERYGHAAVPRRYKRDPSLSSWAMRQRAQWRKLQAGESSYLTPDRLAELEEVGFVFGDYDRRDHPVDDCGVWPKPYQLKKRKKKGASDDTDLAAEAAKVVAITLGKPLPDSSDSSIASGDCDAEKEDDESIKDLRLEETMATNSNAADAEISGDESEAVEREVHKVETMEAEVKSEPESPVLVKGRWRCSKCAKDEFVHFIDACVHEAACYNMQFAVADVL